MKDAIFMGMTFQNFSDLLTVGVLALLTINVLFLVLYFTNNKFLHNLLKKVSYNQYMIALSVVLLGGVVGANMYEQIYGDLPCVLCWYQRVLIYPMLIIAVTEIFNKTRQAHIFITILGMFTLFISSYHYYYHFMKYVMGATLTIPCSASSLLPKCAEAGVVSFGFATMPMMSVIISIFVLTVVYLAPKAER